MQDWEEIVGIADVAKVVASPLRLAILEFLRGPARQVNELADAIHEAGRPAASPRAGQTATSDALQELRSAGFVARSHAGNARLYSLTTRGFALHVRAVAFRDLLVSYPAPAASEA